MAQGSTSLVEDLGNGVSRVRPFNGPTTIFIETVEDASGLPPAGERPLGWPIFNKDTNSVLVAVVDPNDSTAQIFAPPTSGTSVDYAGAKSFQPIAADLNLAAGAGKTMPATAFLAGLMGNLIGDALTKTGNYLAGTIGALSVTGVRAAVNGVGGLLGIIMDGVTDADGAVVAVLDGDSALTKARAMYAVKKNNSVPGSNPDFGLDLEGAAHDGFSILAYLKAALRLDNSVVVITHAGVPAGGFGNGYAGPGSVLSDITNGDLYIQTGPIGATVWKLVTRAA